MLVVRIIIVGVYDTVITLLSLLVYFYFLLVKYKLSYNIMITVLSFAQ